MGATRIATQFFAHKRSEPKGFLLFLTWYSFNTDMVFRLPDSAIDLIDEACASATLARSTNSEEVWKLQRKRVVLEMDLRSLMACGTSYSFLRDHLPFT